MKTILKTTYYSAVTILFLLIAVVGFTQTKTFRSYIRTVVINELQSVLRGTVDFKAIEGNLATGLELRDVVIASDGREIFYAERLEARYELPSVFFQRASISRVTLLRPRIHLWRGLDGLWNFENLIVPADESDTTSSPWVLDFRSVELLEATVDVIDSLALLERSTTDQPTTPELFDFANLNLPALSMHTSLYISPDGVSATIRSLEARSYRPDFHLYELSGQFLLRPRMAEIKSFKIRTKNSRLALDASISDIDFGSIGNLRDLEASPVRLALAVDKLDFTEFKQFLPGPVDFLDQSSSFDVKASGKFGNLTIDEVVVRTPRTYLKVQGSMRNLHRPEFLELDLSARDNIIHPEDLPDLLPGLDLPDFRNVGILNCDLRFQGTPAQFKAIVAGRIPSGEFSVDADLDLRRGFGYSGTVTTKRLDAGQLFDNKTLSSSLNTVATIAGSGTSLRSMRSVLRVQADSSMILGFPVSNSVLVVDVADKSLRSNLLVNAGPTRLDFQTRSDFAVEDSISYTIRGKVYSLDLSTPLQDSRYESRLSFTLDASGRGLNPASMKTDVQVHILPSSYGSDLLEAQDFSLSYDAIDSVHRSLTVRSAPADVQMEGDFTPGAIVDIFRQSGTILAGALAHRFSGLDSLRATLPVSARRPYVARGPIPQDTVSATVGLTFRDLYPLGVFLGERLNGSADIQSTVKGSLRDLHIHGAAVVRTFSLAGTTPLDLSDVDLTFSLNHLQAQRTLELLDSEISLIAARVLIDSTLFSDVVLRHNLREDSASYSVTTIIDSTINVSLEGTSTFVPHTHDLTLSRLSIKIADHDFHNPDSMFLQSGRDGIRFTNAVVQHEAEEIVLNGVFDPWGDSNLRFSVENFLLNNLKEFSRDPVYTEKVRTFNGVLDLAGTFRGSLDKPSFNVALSAGGVTIGETVFGKITGRGTYQNGIADMFLEFRSKPNEPKIPPELFVSGIMPVQLGAGSEVPKDQEMDLTLRSRGFRLEFLDPFVSVISNLRGSLTGDIVMRGTPKSPLYEGSLAVEDSRFLFVPLGITYQLNGRLVPVGKTIALENFVLSNVSEDRVPGIGDGLGSMNLTGRLTLEGLSVKQFDVSSGGQLLVMKESARLAGVPLYGNIYIGTGANALRWFGAPERSFVVGDVLIKNANITFPPSRNVLLERAQMFTVSYVDDTSKTISDVPVGGGRSLALAHGTNGGPVITQEPVPSQEPGVREEEPSFLENIVYNLSLETAGLTQVRFVFNQLTKEELSADLTGRLIFTKDESSSRVTGELEIGQRSYYKYFKTLQASGKLLFTGDIANPELDIDATYEGTYTSPDSIEQKVIVRLEITGTREEPKVKMGLDVYDREGTKLAGRADPQGDAIAFLVSGTFKDQMTEGEQSTLLTSSLLGSIGSSLLSGPLTELVRNRVGYITSIDVYYYGGADKSFGQSADIRLTGEVGDAVIRLGGRVFEDIGNTNVSVQFPMSSITGSEAWRNLILEIERRSDRIESIEQRPPSTGVRLLYRITF